MWNILLDGWWVLSLDDYLAFCLEWLQGQELMKLNVMLDFLWDLQRDDPLEV